MDENFSSFTNMLNAPNIENSSSSQNQNPQNFSNYPFSGIPTNVQNYAFPPNLSTSNHPSNFQNLPNFSYPIPMYPPPTYFNPNMGNHYTSGYYNIGMGCGCSKTPSEIRKDFDFVDQQENTASTESMLDSQFPPYSTQRRKTASYGKLSK